MAETGSNLGVTYEVAEVPITVGDEGVLSEEHMQHYIERLRAHNNLDIENDGEKLRSLMEADVTDMIPPCGEDCVKRAIIPGASTGEPSECEITLRCKLIKTEQDADTISSKKLACLQYLLRGAYNEEDGAPAIIKGVIDRQ